MTVPVRGGRPRADQSVEIAQRNRTIVDVRLRGLSFRKIAEVVRLHPATVSRTYYAEVGTAAFEASLEESRKAYLAEVNRMMDQYRPWMYLADDVEPKPTTPPPLPDVADHMIKLLEMWAKGLAIEPPKLSATMVGGTVTHEVHAESHADRVARRTELLQDLLRGTGLDEQEILDVDVTEIGVETGDSSVALSANSYDPGSNGHGPGHEPASGWAILAD